MHDIQAAFTDIGKNNLMNLKTLIAAQVCKDFYPVKLVQSKEIHYFKKVYRMA